MESNQIKEHQIHWTSDVIRRGALSSGIEREQVEGRASVTLSRFPRSSQK